MKKLISILFILLSSSFVTPAQAVWNPLGQKHRFTGEQNAQRLIKEIKNVDAGMEGIFAKSVGWAVFPSIGKAGFGVGGAAGNGRVYRKGKFIGTTTMSQISIGFQLGGQVYSEIIFFENDHALNRFKSGKFEIGGNLSAVIVDKGAALTARFKDGALVFINPKKGLMYEATISGQKFTFKATKK